MDGWKYSAPLINKGYYHFYFVNGTKCWLALNREPDHGSVSTTFTCHIWGVYTKFQKNITSTVSYIIKSTRILLVVGQTNPKKNSKT